MEKKIYALLNHNYVDVKEREMRTQKGRNFEERRRNFEKGEQNILIEASISMIAPLCYCG